MGLKPRVAERIELTPLRRIIAERMHSSVMSTARVTLMRESLVEGLVGFRERFGPEIERVSGGRLTYTDVVVKAVAGVLRRHPLLNSALEGDYIEVYEEVNEPELCECWLHLAVPLGASRGYEGALATLSWP